MRILLADDSRAMRGLFRGVLERLGHSGDDLLEAKDSRELDAALRPSAPTVDLIIFDWDLPGLDGLGLMARLHALRLNESVSVLFSVNRQQRSLLPQVSRMGTCESIDRPFSEEIFERKLRELVPAVQKRSASSKKLQSLAPGSDSSGVRSFLHRLPPAVMDDLLRFADERRHGANALLLRIGQVCEALSIVTEGEVEIRTSEEGKVLRIMKAGDPYGELSFMMSEPSTTVARARTAVVTASLSKARITELLRKHPDLDVHLSSLMERHREVMTTRATTIVQSNFKGTVDTMPFANVLQILHGGRKTGLLGFRDDERSGGIYMKEGEAVHAWTDDLQGEPAFYALSGWKRAKFAFNAVPRDVPRTLTKPTITLLLEAMSRSEESAAGDAGLDQLFPSP
jgi:two-component system chemotaxis response regulator CheY